MTRDKRPRRASSTADAVPVALLLAITAIWGWTFLIVKDAVGSYPVLPFLALRFLLATVMLVPPALRNFSKADFGMGMVIGVPLACAYLLQTIGLQSTSAANAGLLTGLFVIFTPILDAFLYRATIPRITGTMAVAGVMGTALLTLSGATGITIGDGFEVLTAIALGLHTVWLGRSAINRSATHLVLGQMAVAAISFTVLSSLTTLSLPPAPSRSVMVTIVVTGGLASALAFLVQTWVQQRVSPSRAAIILLGEPAFAAGFAVWLGGERLNITQWSGAALILASLVVHEVRMAISRERVVATLQP